MHYGFDPDLISVDPLLCLEQLLLEGKHCKQDQKQNRIKKS